MHILGNTIKKIAYEKAGIIKEGVPVITSEHKREALSVIRNVCKEKHSKLIIVEPKRYRLKLKGELQQLNAACAVEAVKQIGIRNIKGLYETQWPGRMEKKGNIVYDVAHNPAGIKAMSEAITAFTYKNLIIVFAVKNDKNVEGMVRYLPKAKEIILTRYSIAPGSLSPDKIPIKGKIIRDAKEAINYAKTIAGKNDLILVTGSTFLVSEVRGATKQIVS